MKKPAAGAMHAPSRKRPDRIFMKRLSNIILPPLLLLAVTGCTCTTYRDIYFSRGQQRSGAEEVAGRVAAVAGFREAGSDDSALRFQDGDIGFLYDRRADAIVVHSRHCGRMGTDEWKARCGKSSRIVSYSFGQMMGAPLEKLAP
jgi:hypothetical protein